MFPPELPPVKNKILYAYRVFGKWLSFFIFGFGSVILGILVLPPMRLFLHPKTRFQKYGRRFISGTFRFFIMIMRIIGVVKLSPDDKKKYKNLSSKIIVANHPSILDVVMLISLIPNADCIVSAYLKRHILTGVASQLYILGSRDLDDIFHSCSETLNLGNCLIIFPEGTRTRRNVKPILKKGAARVALNTGCGIVPVHIGGTDKFGLGKKDPWKGFNPTEKYIYKLRMGEEISVEKYKDIPAPAAAKLITNEIKASLFPES
jgi:1-acyl-sn-glycerol-3-phosphate acyltransferase